MKAKSLIRLCRCGETYERFSTLQTCCTDCLVKRGRKFAERKAKAERKAAGKLLRERRENIKNVSDYLAAAQIVFNRWIVHVRDKGLPCISCGTTKPVQMAAGHYRSRGASGAHRFNPDNCFAQCNAFCNLKKSGNAILMRQGMIARIGLERVEALENDNTLKKWTKEEALAIKAKYAAKLKELK